MKEKAKASKLKEIAQSNRMQFYEATTDNKLIHFRNYLKEENEGLIVLDRKYGRGSDIRFKVDSFVLVTFIPNDTLELTQLAGRSSRTMKQHSCAVVTQHNIMNADNIRHKVEAGNRNVLKEKNGIEVVKIMIGRRFAGVSSDRELV